MADPFLLWCLELPILINMFVYVSTELLQGHRIKQVIQQHSLISQLMNPCHGYPWHHNHRNTNLNVAPPLCYFCRTESYTHRNMCTNKLMLRLMLICTIKCSSNWSHRKSRTCYLHSLFMCQFSIIVIEHVLRIILMSILIPPST